MDHGAPSTGRGSPPAAKPSRYFEKSTGFSVARGQKAQL
jgi:hypothetical protein